MVHCLTDVVNYILAENGTVPFLEKMTILYFITQCFQATGFIQTGLCNIHGHLKVFLKTINFQGLYNIKEKIFTGQPRYLKVQGNDENTSSHPNMMYMFNFSKTYFCSTCVVKLFLMKTGLH